MTSFSLTTLETSIKTTYRKYLWAPFLKAIKDYQLIEPGDVVGVAVSGGKDSLVMAKLLQLLKRHHSIPFEVVFLSMDPGFNAANKQQLIANCELLDLPVHYFSSDIFEVSERVGGDYPCYMCARMRRGFLYTKASELGCTKLALGHHFDDVIETTLLNLFYSSTFKTMLPKVHSSESSDLELIRPMYLIKEQSIISFMKAHHLTAMACGCKVAAGQVPSKRREIKALIAHLKKTNPQVDWSIFKAADNVNTDHLLSYLVKGEKHHFLDDF